MSLEAEIESLVERYRRRKKNKILAGITAAVLCAGITGYMLLKNKPEEARLQEVVKIQEMRDIEILKKKYYERNLELRTDVCANPDEGEEEDSIVKNSRLVFMRDYKICICNHDGTDGVAVSGGIFMQPCWAPDAMRVRFRDIDIPCLLELVNTSANWDGWVKRDFFYGIKYSLPSYSPDGIRYAFLEKGKESSGQAPGSAELTRIYVSMSKEIICDPVLDPPHASYKDFYSWSPDSSGIAVVRGGNIYIGDRELTRDPAKEYQPCFSPDGKRIAFVSEKDKRPRIYIIASDGSDEKALLQEGMESETFPSWSPTGNQIVFLGKDKESYGMYSISSEGSGGKRFLKVTERGSALFSQPSWTINGKKIAFSCDLRNDGIRLFTINSDGTGLRDLGFADAYTPSWSPPMVR